MRFECGETCCRSAAGPVARADDVIHEVAFVVCEHESSRGATRREARHHIVVMEAHDLAGSAELIGILAVPQREQHVTVRAHEDADLRVLPRAVRSRAGDGLDAVARCERQLEHVHGLGAQALEGSGLRRHEILQIASLAWASGR